MEETVVMDSSVEIGSLKRRLLHGDVKKFDKYVKLTSTHGVKHVFSGKSKIRRTFWGILFLASIAGCLYGIINSIVFFSKIPTATTVYTDHVESLTFPAVTICNLNGYRLSVLNDKNWTEYVTASIFQSREGCNITADAVTTTGESLSTVIHQVSQPLKDLIVKCSFMGEPCDLDSVFTPYATPTGTCYIFNERNSSNELLSVTGSGFRHSLQLVLNIQQEDYSGSAYHEAGALVSVHEQGTSPLVWESGVAVPVGHSAYLSVTQNQIEDKTNRNTFDNGDCLNDPPSLEFLKTYKYSYRACRADCILMQIAGKCNCSLSLVSGQEHINYTDCTLSDLCCIFSVVKFYSNCSCNVLCSHASFDVTPSYSSFPAVDKAINEYNFSSVENVMNNLLQIRVFFGGLSIHRETTERSYTLTELISNIGGSMGIFLGASIISLTEFLVLIIDEIKDRLCGVRERNIKQVWRTYKLKTALATHPSAKSDNFDAGYTVYLENSSMDSSPTSSTEEEPIVM